jgi:hypothetical protein
MYGITWLKGSNHSLLSTGFESKLLSFNKMHEKLHNLITAIKYLVKRDQITPSSLLVWDRVELIFKTYTNLK